MTIMPFLAQGETVAPRQPVMHHGFPKMHHDFGQCTKLSPEMHHENEKCTKLFLKCTKANGKMQPGFLILSKLVRKPILNIIIKIGSRTECFSLIFRAFFDLPVLRRKSKTVKN